MLFKLKLLESNLEISQNIMKALLPDIADYFKDVIYSLKANLPPVIRNTIINSSEYQSILNGQLQYEFGIPDPGSKLAGLLDIWSQTIKVTYNAPTISGNKIKGSFSVNMIRVDFSDVLYSEYAIVYDALRGYSLPWLEWLLLEGNKTIISNYGVIIGPNKSSRTGMAVMRQSSGSWKVPSQFAGTIGDNWITRAIDNAENEIENVINKALDQ
jgi:hypothetical protein